MAAEGCSTSSMESSEKVEVMKKATELLSQGKRNMVCGEVPKAITFYNEAVQMLAKEYGDMSRNCADAYFSYGSALLELGRMETNVLGVALEGVDVEAKDDEAESDQFEKPPVEGGEEREKLRTEVYEAMAEGDREEALKTSEGKTETKEKIDKDTDKATDADKDAKATDTSGNAGSSEKKAEPTGKKTNGNGRSDKMSASEKESEKEEMETDTIMEAKQTMEDKDYVMKETSKSKDSSAKVLVQVNPEEAVKAIEKPVSEEKAEFSVEDKENLSGDPRNSKRGSDKETKAESAEGESKAQNEKAETDKGNEVGQGDKTDCTMEDEIESAVSKAKKHGSEKDTGIEPENTIDTKEETAKSVITESKDQMEKDAKTEKEDTSDHEIEMKETKTDTEGNKTEAKEETKTEGKDETKSEATEKTRTEAKEEMKTESKKETQSESKEETKTESKEESKTETVKDTAHKDTNSETSEAEKEPNSQKETENVKVASETVSQKDAKDKTEKMDEEKEKSKTDTEEVKKDNIEDVEMTDKNDKDEEEEVAEEDEETAEAEGVENQEGEASQEGEESQDDGEEKDEDVPNFQLAWEYLDLAKVIYLKSDSKDDQLKAAECHIKLGEVSMETEQHNIAAEDLESALKIQQQHLPADDRVIAETHYQLGLAYGLGKEFEKSIENYHKAISVIEAKIASLNKLVEEKEVNPENKENCATDALQKYKDEIKELQELVPEMRNKIEDTKSEAKDMERIKEMAKEMLGLSGTSKGFGSPTKKTEVGKGDVDENGEKKATDISSLVRKKRKPEEEEETSGTVEVKKLKADGDAPAEIKENGADEAKNGTAEIANGHATETEMVDASATSTA